MIAFYLLSALWASNSDEYLHPWALIDAPGYTSYKVSRKKQSVYVCADEVIRQFELRPHVVEGRPIPQREDDVLVGTSSLGDPLYSRGSEWLFTYKNGAMAFHDSPDWQTSLVDDGVTIATLGDTLISIARPKVSSPGSKRVEYLVTIPPIDVKWVHGNCAVYIPSKSPDECSVALGVIDGKDYVLKIWRYKGEILKESRSVRVPSALSTAQPELFPIVQMTLLKLTWLDASHLLVGFPNKNLECLVYEYDLTNSKFLNKGKIKFRVPAMINLRALNPTTFVCGVNGAKIGVFHLPTDKH